MYSYITFKATRKPVLVKAGLDIRTSVAEASTLYDHSKMLFDHGLLASGVSVLVMTDTICEKVVADGCLSNISTEDVVYQCGGY